MLRGHGLAPPQPGHDVGLVLVVRHSVVADVAHGSTSANSNRISTGCHATRCCCPAGSPPSSWWWRCTGFGPWSTSQEREDGEYAAVLFRAPGEIQFGEDRGDVRLDGPLGNEEPARDRSVGHAFGDQPKHI